jgi:hypothetical protein
MRPLAWADVLVARRFDAACRVLVQSRLLRDCAPKDLFDGFSFFTFVREARAGARRATSLTSLAEAAAVPLPTPPASMAMPTPMVLDPAGYGARGGANGGGETSGRAVAAAAPSERIAGIGACGECSRQCGFEVVGQYDARDGQLYCIECWRVYDEHEERLKLAPPSPPAAAPPPPKPLPVEEHEAEIVRRVKAHRVCVISGETGCGKSSRVPMMILKAAGSRSSRIMVAQPRRLAAHSLHQRAVEMGHGPLVGLRMQGVSVQTKLTRLWYCTTGYLARLVGHRPEIFGQVSHLVIDECHERSVDADVLCLLCRRLLSRFPRLRLVLMSATAHNDLVREYFARTLGWEAV